MSEIMIASGRFLIADGSYSAQDVAQIVYHALEIDRRDRDRLNSAVLSLAGLLDRIVVIAQTAEKHKLPTLLEQLAAQQASATSITHLAAEITKRLDIVQAEFYRYTGGQFGEHGQEIVTDSLAIRRALLDFERDGGEALRAVAAHHVSIQWATPDAWGRPPGPTAERVWFAEQIISLKKMHPGDPWWLLGRRLLERIYALDEKDLRPEHVEARKFLEKYAEEDDRGFHIKQVNELSNAIRKAVERHKKSNVT